MTDDIRYTLCRKSGKLWCFFVRRYGTPPDFHTAAPKFGPHARACAHTRPRHRRGVGERPCSLLPNLDALTAPQSDEMV